MQEGKSEIQAFCQEDPNDEGKDCSLVRRWVQEVFRVGTGGDGTEIGYNLMDLRAPRKVLLLQIENTEGN